MNQRQWETLLAVLEGQLVSPLPVGFIIDSPWLPAWHGVSILDYYADPHCWFQANLHACNTFPEILFLPGFWAEYGMCSEPASLGTRCTFYENDLPFAHPLQDALNEITEKPDPAVDGLAPLLLHRLCSWRPKIEEEGQAIRFAVARGPLNIASFLLGISEFLMALRMYPEKVHALLRIITDFLLDWLRLQKEKIDSIDGIFILDDIVGFLGAPDYEEFAHAYLGELFSAFPASVRFFHNDAEGLICAPYLPALGVNLFNFSHLHSIAEMQALTGGKVTLLGNIAPLETLAQGSPADVKLAVTELIQGLESPHHLILSCGGGMAPGVPTENINAFLAAAQEGQF
ncbi:MAG: uroporphyrinogen decarboxylase [Candidatus Hydrogenedens sp.]|jgi:uroporphyrinogen decarboxylase|nr:uroporphyrinogen decarboxylase [Candidatus Hydrogenedens sp.]